MESTIIKEEKINEDNNNNNYIYNELPSFSLVSQNNRKTYPGSEHPSKRWGHSVVLHNRAMIIFGGRHSQRSLSNIYSLDFITLTWSKIEPLGNIPPARDSHSAVIYNDSDMIIFGGNGSTGKLNDLWNFNFNDKKWSRITSEGQIPSPRDGHLSILIKKKYMVIYAGLNDNDEVIHEIHIFNVESKVWYKCDIEGSPIQKRDGQSCCQIGDVMYLFGGQGPSDDEYSNDLFMLEFNILEDEKDESKKPKAIISNIEISNNNLRPKVRASQTCVSYKDQFLIIIGGEGKTQVPLDDIWVFDLKSKSYTEINLLGNEKIEGRFCHSCLVYGDILALYGGMQNSEITLDNLTILSLESRQNQKNNSNTRSKNIKKNGNRNNNTEIVSNNKKRKINDGNNGNKNKDKENDVTEKSNSPILVKKELKDISVDTNDLLNMNFYSFEEIKKNYLNNLITWKFLKSLSDFYKWPI